jgi:DNA-binding CsgD family transcriptional regulator
MELKDLEEPELEIAQMADEGFSVRHSAARLDLTERAAAARLRIVFAKLGVRNRHELHPKIASPSGNELLAASERSSKLMATLRDHESYRDVEGMPLGCS